LNISKEIFEYLLSIKEIKEKFNQNEIYIIEKYKLGLHQNEMIECEKWFLDQLTDLEVFKSKHYQNILIYKKGDNVLFNYDEKSYDFYHDFYKIYKIFESKFDLNYLCVKLIVKGMVEEHLKIMVNTTPRFLRTR
jgi:hypothetical protein